MEYDPEQLNTVQQVATRFDGLEVHSWPDDELVRSMSGQLRSKLKAMQQAVSPESFSTRATDASPEQSELARDGESIEHLI
ncbi:radical SAM domain-containing protein [Haloarcula marismortui ATCC 33800]|uniref:Radical SAM domain-containing protein n=2 Tax=Haloarcula marismortui TaxID=2238 RepID=M0JFZ5_9EURY|nr:radical SAM domain-containing protein [Haloarcula sinaiiensis ATCC 33800]EMA09294.1 radical SAM domain-containing protein [Haloarcula californiae ATCC 33799]